MQSVQINVKRGKQIPALVTNKFKSFSILVVYILEKAPYLAEGAFFDTLSFKEYKKNEYIYGKKRECKKELVYRRCQGQDFGPDVNHRFKSPSRQAQARIYTPC